MNCVTMNGFKFSYRGYDFELLPRENSSSSSAKVRFRHGGVKSFVFVYLPFDTSSRYDLEFLYRKAVRAYNEVQENMAVVRSARSFQERKKIYSL